MMAEVVNLLHEQKVLKKRLAEIDKRLEELRRVCSHPEIESLEWMDIVEVRRYYDNTCKVCGLEWTSRRLPEGATVKHSL